MSRFELLALLHGIGVIAWVGGGLALVVLHGLALRSDDYQGVGTAVRQSRELGTWLYGPASVVTAATGIALVATEAVYGFTDLWIIIGIGGVLVGPTMQLTVGDRTRSRYLALLADNESDKAKLRASARSVTLVGTADVAILLIIVWVMYAKPDI